MDSFWATDEEIAAIADKIAILDKSSVYNYKAGKRRSIIVSEIPSLNLTNKNRVSYAKSFQNNFTVSKDDGGNDVNTYKNSRYLFKATAYLIDENNDVTLSNSVYTCLSNVAAKLLASGESGMIEITQN